MGLILVLRPVTMVGGTTGGHACLSRIILGKGSEANCFVVISENSTKFLKRDYCIINQGFRKVLVIPFITFSSCSRLGRPSVFFPLSPLPTQNFSLRITFSFLLFSPTMHSYVLLNQTVTADLTHGPLTWDGPPTRAPYSTCRLGPGFCSPLAQSAGAYGQELQYRKNG